MSSHHQPTVIERSCDLLVVGGSAAGLATALQVVRQQRSVIVIDAGAPRNAPAAHMHGYLGHDGAAPSDLTEAGRAEVRRYGGEVLDGRVVDVERVERGFRATLTGGHAIVARRMLLAVGIVDELPAIDGVDEHWGGQVVHCPFCHGYEVRDQRIVQIVTNPMGLHSALLFQRLASEFTIVVHDPHGIDPAELAALAEAGTRIVHDRVERLTTESDGRLSGVELESGGRIATDVVAVGPRFRVDLDAFVGIGLPSVAHASGLGDTVEVDETGRTAVSGVWAAGNVTDPSQQVLQAAAAGSRTGAMVVFDLAREDLASGSTVANEADWDRRYGGDRIWSGNPNGALVAEIGGTPPGTALDVGAGEGGDAIWLAEAGWTVTASDISSVGLGRVSAEAARRGLDVTCLRADANESAPFDGQQYDLVTAHYASIPRTPDRRAIDNMIGAVAPGGTLLVVSHDLEPMRRPVDTGTASRVFDPDAYVRVDDVAAVLVDDPAWTIEVHETRARPPGAASASHHVDDIVLRARRTARNGT